MIPGKYELVARQGYAEVLAAADMPAAMTESYCHPDNKSTMCICVNKDGSFTTKQCNPKAPELNDTTTFKIGEEITKEKPVPMKILVSKTGENKYLMTTKMGSITSDTTFCFNNFGAHVSTYVQGKGVSGCEIYKRVEPKVDGYYIMESEKNAVDFFLDSVPADKKEEARAMFKNVAFRFRRNGKEINMVQRYGDYTKEQCITLDQEYKDTEPALGMETVNIVTETAPGAYKIVSRNTKNGQVIEMDILFTNAGMHEKGIDKKTGKTFEICYRRSLDMEGKWKVVATSNMDTYLEMLGVPEPMKTELLNDRPTICICRQPGDLICSKSTSKIMPDMVFKLGEEFTIDFGNGLGSGKALLTECNGELLTVMKYAGKCITQKTKVSGQFCLTEVEVDGNMASRMKTISIRE